MLSESRPDAPEADYAGIEFRNARMYARLTRYKIKPEHIDEARALVNEMGSAGIDSAGVFQLINLGRDDGSGVLIAIYQSQEDAARVSDRIKQAWKQIIPFLDRTPEPDEFDVISYEIAAKPTS